MENQPEKRPDVLEELFKTAAEHADLKHRIAEQNIKDFGNPFGRVCISKAMHDRLEQAFKNGELK